MKKNKINIIIVTYKSEKFIKKCLQSINLSKTNNIDINIEIIDNSPDNKTKEAIFSPGTNNLNIKYHKNQRNLGFAKSVNICLDSEDFDSFLLLNPDTVLEENSLFELLNCRENNQESIIGGATYDLYNKESGSHFRIPNIYVGMFDFTFLRKVTPFDYWHKWFYYLLDSDKKITSTCSEVGAVTGGYMLIPRSVIKKIGKFDEDFFMYLEDVDFCLRAKKAGIPVLYCPSSKIYHYSGGSAQEFGHRSLYSAWFRSRSSFYKKNFGLLVNFIIQPIFMVDEIYTKLKLKLN